MVMRPVEHGATQAPRGSEREVERASDQARQRTDRKPAAGECQQAGAVVFRFIVR